MNLHDIVSSAITSVNPLQSITITPRNGFTTDEFGEATSSLGEPYTIMADVQPTASEDIKFIKNYNESSVYKTFWVSANTFGVNRPMAKGGDKVDWNGQEYYVVNMPEDWYATCGWSHFVGQLQLTQSEDPNE